jgi:hypothetical protein
MNTFRRIGLVPKLVLTWAASMALMAGIMMTLIFDLSNGKSLLAAHLRAILAPCVFKDSLGCKSDALSIGPASPEHATCGVWTGKVAALANVTHERVRDIADERKTGLGSRSP